MIGVNYWWIMGIFYLFLLSLQDIFNKMKIDDRRNWFMMGATLALFSHLKEIYFWYLLLILGISFFLLFVFKKFKVFGDGDLTGLLWIFIGFGILDILYLIVFLISLLVLYVIFIILIKSCFPKIKRFPFYPIIFLSFLYTSLDLYFGVFGG